MIVFLLVEQADHRVGRVLVELGRVSAGQVAHVAGEFDHGALHAQADAEERDAFASRAKRMAIDFAFDAALAKAAGDEQAVVAAQQPFGAFAFRSSSLWMRRMRIWARWRDAGVVERFVDRFVGVAMLGVFADDGDADFVLGVSQPLQQIAPVVEVRLVRFSGRAGRTISSSSLFSTRLSGTS